MGKNRGRTIKGVSFPLRIGNNGGFVMSKDNTHIESRGFEVRETFSLNLALHYTYMNLINYLLSGPLFHHLFNIEKDIHSSSFDDSWI